MAWTDNGILILRTLIWDNDVSVSYSDSRLEEVLIVAASQIVVEIDFDTDYTVNVNTISISPDPVDDKEFMFFMTLKAACIIDRGNMRLASMSAGIEAKCGPAVMKTIERMPGFKILLESGYCKTYETLKYEYEIGNAAYIRAILSPFINGDFDPEDYSSDSFRSLRYDR